MSKTLPSVFKARLTPLSIALVYALVGGVWMFVTNTLIGTSFKGQPFGVWLAVLNGVLLIGVSSVLLFLLIRRREATITRSQESLRRTNRALATLSECDQALLHALDEQGFLRDVCRIAVDHGGYRQAWVWFAEADGVASVRPVACWDNKSAEVNIPQCKVFMLKPHQRLLFIVKDLLSQLEDVLDMNYLAGRSSGEQVVSSKLVQAVW